ncbi:hypothetical protein FPZ43_03885 [Mucilaginibacter pallidiroseus]|uniref:Uncharacterized protein n=1 Tax=Mucilaginibacter pallidiroseus TaxID=2599295 RepID=A0A563UJR8_9SPHI|nr:hypothetical protein [Mucilaginibacter pallidiroseus]TWR31622.1 hypothetical protein FPZ43_03885 [Mucilaginibacter pallidiroseus]
MSFYNSVSNTTNASTSLRSQINTASTSKQRVNDVSCGSILDFPFEMTTSKGDTAQTTVKGAGRIFINCQDNQVSGYGLLCASKYTGFNTKETFEMEVQENYTVKSLATAFSKMQLDGTQYSLIVNKPKNTKAFQSSQTNNFTMKALVINTSTTPFDIVSGTADFGASGVSDGRPVSFKGVITFLGNHKADVAFDGKVVSVDLLTGKTSVK